MCLNDEQRMPAQVKEVVVHADLLEIEHLAPDRCDLRLEITFGRDECGLRDLSDFVRHRQGFPVHLAVRRLRIAIKSNEIRRNHELR